MFPPPARMLLRWMVPLSLALGAAGCGSAKAAPEQPIEFPHDVHAGTYKIPCQYCHSSVSKSQFAGIPAVGTCMGCHRITARDKPRIQQLATYWQEEKSIPWTRVHDLPDFVQFTHQPHIRAEVACADCHGEVQTMEAVKQVEPLTMGWCLDCHLEREASTDCLTCHF
ncbi:MAG: cytochrome c3 family protein [Gemmatimonadota bacterium]